MSYSLSGHLFDYNISSLFKILIKMSQSLYFKQSKCNITSTFEIFKFGLFSHKISHYIDRVHSLDKNNWIKFKNCQIKPPQQIYIN